MRLVGPFPFIASGKIRMFLYRTDGGPTLAFYDDDGMRLDEVSIRVPTTDEKVIQAYADAVRAFNASLSAAYENEEA